MRDAEIVLENTSTDVHGWNMQVRKTQVRVWNHGKHKFGTHKYGI